MKPARRKLTLIPLIAATYFMVAGGPYGLEDIVQKAGYTRALLILLITPLIWSLPVALLVGELSAALPEEGGYYAWVRRALGPLWGFQEAWLSLVASIFDMAIYPTLFVLYLGALWPWASAAWHPVLIGGVLIAVCALWNIGGARAVGDGSVLLMALLL
ncbi:MAG TPA: amino acid permease, partial [Terriglobales bacterium]|nr:amino acid permease [Terriglobales bacterium]